MGEFTEKGILSASGETLISDSSAHTGGTSYDGYIQSITDSAALGSNYLKIEYSVEGTVGTDDKIFDLQPYDGNCSQCSYNCCNNQKKTQSNRIIGNKLLRRLVTCGAL